MSIGSLFSGIIGGLELGLERAGLGPVAWQVEIDPFCLGVLAHHWPEARRYTDVRTVGGSNLVPVRLVCGGFPCTDVSVAGLGAGLDGKHSGLWREFRRIVGELRPEWVVVENVASGKRRWLPQVRADLEALSYGSLAVEVSAFDLGAPHRRARVFVVASDAHGDRLRDAEQWLAARRPPRVRDEGEGEPRDYGGAWLASDAARVASLRVGPGAAPREAGSARPPADADSQGEPCGAEGDRPFWYWSRDGGGDGWSALAPVRGVAHGVPRRMDRLRALGNAVVPQCAEAVGRMIAELDA